MTIGWNYYAKICRNIKWEPHKLFQTERLDISKASDNAVYAVNGLNCRDFL